jgi:hypothetical protein
MNFLKLLIILSLGFSFGVHAEDDFAYGGTRKVYSNDYKNKYTFLMLPVASAKGEKFNFYDYKRDKLICCVSVGDGPFDDNALEKIYDIPTVWVTDITVASGGQDIAGAFTPIVYLGSIDIATALPKDTRLDFDGILVDERAQLGKEKRTLIFRNRIYRVRMKNWEMATDAGALHEYTITDISGIKPIEKPRKVVVHFSIN